jgi:uncharacterized protein YprB with RNaseH-like and TPR domain
MAVATSIKDIREASGCVQLRKATHAVHEALHRAPLLAAFEGQQLDVQGYGRIMQDFPPILLHARSVDLIRQCRC